MGDNLREFTEKIEDLVNEINARKIVEVDGLKYTAGHLSLLTPPKPEVIGIHTLSGVVDYLNENPDSVMYESTIVHIRSHNEVAVISSLKGEVKQRDSLLVANLHGITKFNFGEYDDLESFNVGLQSRFVQDENTANILKLIGNIKDGEVRTFSDDGTTQEVTAKVGLSMVDAAAVPNPVTLSPYRTFPEVEQPSSKFVLRLRPGNPMPTCALFGADGGRWKLEAIRNIREFLKNNLNADAQKVKIIS